MRTQKIYYPKKYFRGYARVHSFLLKGKTYYTTDSDLVKEAKENSKEAKKWWSI